MAVTGARKSLPHGTVSGYINWGCRCEPCRQGLRDYYGTKSLAQHLADIESKHGTEGRYVTRRCRCKLCRTAATEARRVRRARDPEASRAYNREYKRRVRAVA